jgi:Phosphodiester glycosidase
MRRWLGAVACRLGLWMGLGGLVAAQACLGAPLAPVSPLAAASRPDSLEETTAGGVPVRVVRVRLQDPRVRVKVLVCPGFPHADEPFATTLARERPTIAVNGSYFSTTSKRPIGDVVIDGRVRCEGLMGTALAITRDKHAEIRRVPRDRHQDWSGYETVLACGPALVLHGQADARPREEGFRDPHVMGTTCRMGVGLTAAGDMLLVSTLSPVGFDAWARVMQALGCRDAMNLDAGASLGMVYRGQTLLSPSRPLTNLLAIYIDDASSGSPPAFSSRGPKSPSRKPKHPAGRPSLQPLPPAIHPPRPAPSPKPPIFDLY